MNSSLRTVLLRLGAGLLAASPAAWTPIARAAVYDDGITMAQLKSILSAAGKTATDEGDHLIRVTDGPLVYLANCPSDKNGACNEIEIEREFSNVKPTLDGLNKWNFGYKIPEASINDTGNLHLEFWVSTIGITDVLLLDSIDWFDTSWQEDDAQKFWQPFMTDSPTGK